MPSLSPSPDSQTARNTQTRRTAGVLDVAARIVRRHPFFWLIVLVILSNLAGSLFSFFYNDELIVKRLMNEAQRDAFWHVASPWYNAVVYPLALGVSVYLLWPLMACRRSLRAGVEIPPADMERCRRRLVNLPFYQVCVNFLGWIPGAVFFPWIVIKHGGDAHAGDIWMQFTRSFWVSALLSTVQTFFLLEAYLIRILYAEFFQGARPADVRGAILLPFWSRLVLLWAAIAFMPLLALWAVAQEGLSEVAKVVFWVMAGSGGVITWIVGSDMVRWVQAHAVATEQIAQEQYEYRVPIQRPDEWGKLTDHFNDMAAALGRAREVRETFGQMVGPKVRDILPRYKGIGGQVEEITVLFADIRAFTRRSAGEAPENVVRLLNQFLTLAVRAVEDRGGWINKFLGDGVIALFGAPLPCPEHADVAIASARDLLRHLDHFNQQLARAGQAGLHVGVGIHTGPALVGCIGAARDLGDGKQELRKELTAIGETVNLCQRLEQLTKTCGGPILVSEGTRLRLKNPVRLDSLGAQALPGSDETMVVHRVVVE